MTTKEQLLDALDNSRESLLVAIESLPDEALVEKRAIGEWSVSDALINITAWEAELVTGLMRIRQNRRPEKLLEALKAPDKFDEERYVETQDRNLDQIFLDLQQVRVQVEEWILEYSESELNSERRYQWLKGKALKEIVAAATFEREAKVVPQMTLFTQQWQMYESEMPSGSIPLVSIDLNIQDNNHDNTN